MRFNLFILPSHLLRHTLLNSSTPNGFPHRSLHQIFGNEKPFLTHYSGTQHFPYSSMRDTKSSNYDRPPEKVSIDTLACDNSAFKSWKKQIEDREHLNRMNISDTRNISAKHAGTLYEFNPSRFKRVFEKRTKALDDAINHQEHPFERNLDDHHYELNGTRIPQSLDHWIDEPGMVKNARDLRLLKKIERAREKIAQRTKAKHHSLLLSSTSSSPNRQLVSRRMMRINYALLEELNQQLLEMPSNDSRYAISASDPSKRYSTSLNASISPTQIYFNKVEVTSDLMNAKVYWECLGGHAPSLQRQLEKNAKILRHRVTQILNMKYSPQLTFIHITSSQKQVETRELLHRVEEQVTALSACPDPAGMERKLYIPRSSKTATENMANEMPWQIPLMKDLRNVLTCRNVFDVHSSTNQQSKESRYSCPTNEQFSPIQPVWKGNQTEPLPNISKLHLSLPIQNTIFSHHKWITKKSAITSLLDKDDAKSEKLDNRDKPHMNGI